MFLLCIAMLLFGLATSAVNITTLLDSYVLTCGNKLCNHYKDIPEIPHLICPDCSCDPTCLRKGDCCLDIFLSFNVECVNTTIMSYFENEADFDDEDTFLMKTSCPEGTDITIREKCEGFKTTSEQFVQLPVSSSVSQYTYLNKFCAECHNESEVNSWLLQTDCLENVDFNMMSDFADIIETMINRKCKISSYYNNQFVTGCNMIYLGKTINSCNVSGTWALYDETIEWGCLNFDSYYRVYKNVFCYMCNPPIETKPPISNCNVTGYWTILDAEMIEACENLGHTPTTFPFKNVFCFSCNIDKNGHEFLDAGQTYISESFDEGYFDYVLAIKYFPKNSFATDLYNLSEALKDTVTEPSKPEIYEQYYAMTGNEHLCGNTSQWNMSSNRITDNSCSCDDLCHFNRIYPCCVDASLRYSTSCIEGRTGTILVYDSCENVPSGYEALSEKCRTADYEEDLLFSIPVYDFSKDVKYKNIYCGLCRYYTDDIQFNKEIPLNDILRPMNLNLRCEIDLPIHFHVYLLDLLDSRHQSKCNISIEPDICPIKCQETETYEIDSCQNNGPSLAWACQKYSQPSHLQVYTLLDDTSLLMYSNIFCAMCTPNNSNSSINTCNKTGLWDTYDEQIDKKCRELPEVAYHKPYKNIFCKMCNEATIKYMKDNETLDWPCSVYQGDPQPPQPPHFRLLFSLGLYGVEDDKISSSGIKCNTEQVYDNTLVSLVLMSIKYNLISLSLLYHFMKNGGLDL